jgi:uncharacterized protein (DUF362 family)
MTSRREFLKTAAGAGSLLAFDIRNARAGNADSAYFGVHDFIETHPDAVFIFRTNVDVKTNTASVKDAGYTLGKTLFVTKPGPASAFPVTGNVAIKPNITSWSWDIPPIETTMGIQTDPWFVEGVIKSLTDLTVPAVNMFIRDANYVAGAVDGKWYGDLAARTGINMRQFLPVGQGLAPGDVQWIDVPTGIWYKRIPYLVPFNTGGSCFINIAKFKSHGMGMTLCSKNIQGTNAQKYQAHCTAWGTAMAGVDAGDIQTNAFPTIQSNYNRHKDSIPRWKTLDGDPACGSAGGLWMETHTTRCCDNNSVTQPVINIIEGVYGREGSFVSGPSPAGYGIDIMTNVVIFGKNARHVDLIGVYLAGHEPGNFGLFHIASERGLSRFLNPHDVPLYEWKSDGSATLTPLDSFQRTPIRTVYLPQPGEDAYHLVNQPFDYTATSAGRMPPRSAMPDAFVISQNFPNPFNPTTSIQYHIPKSGNVRIEVFDVRGEVVDVLLDSIQPAGDHLVVWRSDRRASGTYFYRISFGDVVKTKSMILIR